MFDTIDVIASFTKDGKVLPHKFRYGSKVYEIQKVNLSQVIKRGANRIVVFYASDNANDWTLLFDTENLKWNLKNQYSST